MAARSSSGRSSLEYVVGVVISIIILVLLFRLAIFIFKLLWMIAPLAIVASVIIDRSVFLGFVGTLKRLWQRNWVTGLAATVASVALLPFTAAYLLGMALFRKKVKEKAAERDEAINGKWTDFEDVSEPGTMDIGYTELPPAPEPEPRSRDKDDNGYDELFR